MSRPSRRSHSTVAGSERMSSAVAGGPPLGSRSCVAFRFSATCAVAITYSSALRLLVETAIDRALREALVEHLAHVVVLHLRVRRAERRLRVRELLRPRDRLARRDGEGVEIVGRAHRLVVGRLEALLENLHAEGPVGLDLLDPDEQ